jgi:F-type H+-transporting ATPase subunit gamma
METLQSLERKIKSAGDLHSVVRTMKSLAAVEIRQYEEAVRSLNDYYRAVELGLRAALLQKPLLPRAKEPGETVVLIFGSDQGMAGRFNEAVVDAVENAVKEERLTAKKPSYWVVGAKAAGGVEERFGVIEQFFALPSAVTQITAAVQELVLRFEQHRSQQGEVRLVLFYNVPLKSASYRQTMVHLLPPDPAWLEKIGGHNWPGRGLPFYTLPWEELFAALIGEYLFVSLFRAFASSLAAENAARLAAMQRAEKNIEEMKDEMSAHYHALRQSTITEELLDVISGFEALTSKQAEGRRH